MIFSISLILIQIQMNPSQNNCISVGMENHWTLFFLICINHYYLNDDILVMKMHGHNIVQCQSHNSFQLFLVLQILLSSSDPLLINCIRLASPLTVYISLSLNRDCDSKLFDSKRIHVVLRVFLSSFSLVCWWIWYYILVHGIAFSLSPKSNTTATISLHIYHL